MQHFKLLFLSLFLMPVFCLGQDVYELKWGPENRYKGALIVYELEESGIARIKWDDNMIEQSFVLEYSNDVMVLDGYDPVYAGTNVSHSSYNADNFYITIDDNGVYNCLNIDDANSISKVSIRKIIGNRAVKNKFLKEFKLSVSE
jgi:hypothetical protein